MIEGLQPLAMAGGQFVSFSWALKSGMAGIRDDYDYDFINGITGAAFMIQASDDEECKAWWTTGNQTLYLDFVAEVFGVPMKRLPEGFGYPGDVDEYLEDPEEYFEARLKQAVAGSLDQGRPVLAQGAFGPGLRAGQWSVIAGLHEGFPVGLAARGEDYELSETLPWQVVILGEPGEEADPVAAVRRALSHAVDLLRGNAPSEPGWRTGDEVWEEMISGLEGDFYCDACEDDHANCLYWDAAYLAGARVSAANFIDMAKEILELSSEALDEAGAALAKGVNALVPLTALERAQALLDGDREALVAALSEARDADRRAASALEKFLGK